MDSLVADIAVAVVPVPMPVVVDQPPCEGALLRGSLPEIPVERGGCLLVGLMADRRAPPIDQAARHINLANGALAQMSDRFLNRLGAAQLHPVLNDAVVFVRRLNQLAA